MKEVYCTDCKYHSGLWSRLLTRDPFCMRKTGREISFATGKSLSLFCDVERMHCSRANYCGMQAQYFEPKKGVNHVRN